MCLQFDESSKTFSRSLHLHINEEQLRRFEEMTDVHDMDQLISEVLSQSRSGMFELFQEMYLTWKDLLILYWDRIMSSRQIVIGLQFAGFVLIWFASRKFKFSFSVVGLLFVLFYLYSFLDSECHRVSVYFLIAIGLLLSLSVLRHLMYPSNIHTLIKKTLFFRKKKLKRLPKCSKLSRKIRAPQRLFGVTTLGIKMTTVKSILSKLGQRKIRNAS